MSSNETNSNFIFIDSIYDRPAIRHLQTEAVFVLLETGNHSLLSNFNDHTFSFSKDGKKGSYCEYVFGIHTRGSHGIGSFDLKKNEEEFGNIIRAGVTFVRQNFINNQ